MKTLNNDTYITTSLKIGDLNIHVKSGFHSHKSLYDILFRVANTRLKEKLI